MSKKESRNRYLKKERWIIHVDGDAFFASCEQATNWKLKGKPVAVGRERGVATAFSYEAKALGVSRAVKSHIIQRDFPDVILVSSDYRKYGIYSERFKKITRRYVSAFETGGIDECYGLVETDDIYELCRQLKYEIETSLGMTFSIGAARTKALAKLAGGLQKPSGITILRNETLHHQIGELPLGKIAGIGYRSEPKMNAVGLYTITDFINKTPVWIADHFHRPTQELHAEISGRSVWRVENVHELPKSISKIRAFRPHTNDKKILLSEFSRNAEIVALKLRKHQLEAYGFYCGLKYKEHTQTGKEVRLSKPIRSSTDMIRVVRSQFNDFFDSNIEYRATYIVVYALRPRNIQTDLFGSFEKIESREEIDKTTDSINSHYGKHILHLASSMKGFSRKNETEPERELTANPLLIDSDSTKALYLPYWGVFGR